MKELIKYVGIILILIGVAIMAIPQFMGTTTNGTLITGLGIIIAGLISYIVINRNVD